MAVDETVKGGNALEVSIIMERKGGEIFAGELKRLDIDFSTIKFMLNRGLIKAEFRKIRDERMDGPIRKVAYIFTSKGKKAYNNVKEEYLSYI